VYNSSECVVRGLSIFSGSQKDKNLLVCWWCTETKAPKTTQCLRSMVGNVQWYVCPVHGARIFFSGSPADRPTWLLKERKGLALHDPSAPLPPCHCHMPVPGALRSCGISTWRIGGAVCCASLVPGASPETPP
jgi:hypothetical protein